jgi:O-antigen biosynthesis protein
VRAPDRIKAYGGQVLLGLLRMAGLLLLPCGLRSVYRSLLIHFIQKTELFDRDFYMEHHPDVARSGMLPLRHYVAYGDREGRAPVAFFDPAYYRAHATGRTVQVNALLHYAWVGRYHRISPSPWFDVDYYLCNNKDVARSGRDPLLHYLKWGGLEGRCPSAQFDGAFYLRTNPDVMHARMNPLLHYLVAGRLDGRPIRPDPAYGYAGELEEPPEPMLPEPRSWSGLTPRANVAGARVDVIVPVYKGRAETLSCIYSVLSAATDASFELIVINDASPDPDLAADLNGLAGLGLFTLLENPKNRGFVWTVNRGMKLHPGRDVVLLNADTEVYDGWLDRLHAAARRHGRTGTVTPLSNNATICSYPRFLHDNPYPLELPYAELDALTARVNEGIEVEAPTGVGFCMYITRACLAEVGRFDERAFGRGYGEENDFCQRAIKHGWRNVIACDVFVRHWGSCSFQGEKAKRIRKAMKIMDRRHPGYKAQVMEFIRRDELTAVRTRLDWARLARLRRDRNVLIVSHNRGGGTERHVQEDAERLAGDGLGVFFMRPTRENESRVYLGSPQIRFAPNLPSIPLRDVGRLARKLEKLGIDEIHTHSLVDLGPEAPIHVHRVVGLLGARWEVNLHDYKVICPRINLADENGRYCGEPGDEVCNRCLEFGGNDFGVKDIRAWRSMHGEVLAAADQVLVPDIDVADRLVRYFPEVSITVSPHEVISPSRLRMRSASVEKGAVRHVVVIGAISKLKGYEVLLVCARNAQGRSLPLRFSVLGYTMNDSLMASAGVNVTGKYREEEALTRLQFLKPDLIWLPSLWPETYSYTLSISLGTDCPVAAFDIGAIATRLRSRGMGENLMPLDLSSQPERINEWLMHATEIVNGCEQYIRA